MISFIEFINKQSSNNKINEAFKNSDMNKVTKDIASLFKKNVSGNVLYTGNFDETQRNSTGFNTWYVCIFNGPTDVQVVGFNWKKDENSTTVHSIDFFDSLDIFVTGKSKTKLTIDTLGCSIVHFLPIIFEIINTKNYNIKQSDVKMLGKQILKGSGVDESFEHNVGALTYRCYTNLPQNVVDESFHIAVSEDVSPARAFLNKKRSERNTAYYNRTKSPSDKQKYQNLEAEYVEIRDIVRGGATTLEDIKCKISNNTSVVLEIDKELAKIQKEIDDKREDPQLVFKKMQKYINLVIKGLTPAAILCGAPGVGKTFHVMQMLRAHKYVVGQNAFKISGKCTPRKLYLMLYEYQRKGDILVIDDADSVVGPNASEDIINILKAALDSTEEDEGRLITYGVSGKLEDEEGNPIPKSFYYNGSVIIITNWNAGALDTALKGRSFIQDINFTTQDILNIIKGLIPAISPEKFSMKAKTEAYDYLEALAKKTKEFEISIRTFTLVCKFFQGAANDPDWDNDTLYAMVDEQMRLQASRGRKKY